MFWKNLLIGGGRWNDEKIKAQLPTIYNQQHKENSGNKKMNITYTAEKTFWESMG